MEDIEIKKKIADLKEKYTRFARICKANGLRVNRETVNEYVKELNKLQAQLNQK